MISAQGFSTEYGRGLLSRLTSSLGSWMVITQPEPWAVVEPTIANPPVHVQFADDLSPEHLDHLVASLPAVDAVVGLGGGTAMDTAKWLHWRRQCPLYQAPSLPSVNACFTRMTALRDAGGVRYEGDAVPERVLVDYDLFAAAPRCSSVADRRRPVVPHRPLRLGAGRPSPPGTTRRGTRRRRR